MSIVEFFTYLFEGDVAYRAYTVACIIGAGCFLIAGVIAYFSERADVYVALAFAIVGGVSIATVSFSGTVTAMGTICVAGLAVVGGALYLVLAAVLVSKEKRRQRKRDRAEVERKLQFLLPQKDNSFVRARLHTALNADMGASNSAIPEEDSGEKLRLEYAKKLLAKVWEAPLSTAERLTVEDMEKDFSAYMRKEKWTARDARKINELLSILLKLSAKYSV